MKTDAAHAMIRFGLGGPYPATQPLDDPRGWLLGQLRGPDPGLASGNFAALPDGAAALAAIRADRRQRKAILRDGQPLKGNFKPAARALFLADAKAQLDWAVATPAPFRERLVWFWANHFTVSLRQGNVAALIGPFLREAIRPHVTGRFTDMVLAAERHPAMLLYLANAFSVGPDSRAGRRAGRGLNENLGRECMELHTVSLRAGYTQADVTSMAKLLTGWSVNPRRGSTGFMFRPLAHEPGEQTVLGRRFPSGEAGGIEALRFLATHPATYAALATKLVRHFVADNPPPAAVAKIAGALAQSGGDLGKASAALVALPEAWTPLTKVKTPLEYMVSARRAAPAEAPPNLDIAVLRKLGQPLWAAPLPNGWSDRAPDWTGSDAVLARIDFGFAYAGRIPHAEPGALAEAALGPLLRPETRLAITRAGSRREGLALLFAAPEFQRR